MTARPVRWIRRLTLLAAAAAVGLGPAPLRADREPAAAATVPFELLPSNHMVVRAQLNGKGPFRLVFDLGSPVTLLGNRAAERCGAIARDAPKSFLFAIRGEGKVAELRVGDLTARDLPVIVMDHPALKVLGGLFGPPLDGIIGYTFFARYKTMIDYRKRELTFAPVAVAVKDLVEDLPDRMLGPKVARTRTLAPAGQWGVRVGPPADGVAARGVPITAVVPGSPAAAAGLRAGDVLTAIDGRWTATVTDAYAAAAAVPPGMPVPVAILREGREVTATVTPRDGI